MALILTVTPEGRAALRNAKGDGTNAVRIATVGVTATAFAPGAAVPAEIRRLATIAGGATDATAMHVTITDAGSDVYSVRGFGFYLDDGTLFASYGQAGVIVEKSTQSIMQLAVDVQFADIDANTITFGDTNFSNPGATTERQGVSELATNTEAIAGIDTQRVLTPAALAAVLLAYVATTGKAGVVELATDAEAITGTDVGRAVSPANLAAVLAQFLATDTKAGAVYLATDAEAIAGTPAPNLAITPANLAAVIGTLHSTAAQFDTSTKLATTAFVQRALGNYASYINYSANASLPPAAFGSIVYLSGSGPYTITLPLLSDGVNGAKINFQCTAAKATIITNGGETLIAGISNVSSVDMGLGDSLELTRFGGAWYVTGGTLAMKYTGMLAASLAGNGYQKLPSGLIIQWGLVTATTAGGSATLPIAFPNKFLSITGGIFNGTAAAYDVSFGTIGKTGVIAYLADGAGVTCSYVATGY